MNDLRFVEKDGKRILQYRTEMYGGECMSDWIDVPLVDLKKEEEDEEEKQRRRERFAERCMRDEFGRISGMGVVK